MFKNDIAVFLFLMTVYNLIYFVHNVVYFEHEPGLSNSKSLWVQFKNSTYLGFIGFAFGFPSYLLYVLFVTFEAKRKKVFNWVYTTLTIRPFKN
jgi:hypothetical protein